MPECLYFRLTSMLHLFLRRFLITAFLSCLIYSLLRFTVQYKAFSVILVICCFIYHVNERAWIEFNAKRKIQSLKPFFSRFNLWNFGYFFLFRLYRKTRKMWLVRKRWNQKYNGNSKRKNSFCINVFVLWFDVSFNFFNSSSDTVFILYKIWWEVLWFESQFILLWWWRSPLKTRRLSKQTIIMLRNRKGYNKYSAICDVE